LLEVLALRAALLVPKSCQRRSVLGSPGRRPKNDGLADPKGGQEATRNQSSKYGTLAFGSRRSRGMPDYSAVAVSSNAYMEQELRMRASTLATHLDADVLAYIGPIYSPFDGEIRDILNAVDPKRKRLCVVLETEGGSIETTERIANTFRHFYKDVWFIVPNYAMSAGTVLVMSGDRIWMDYYAILGPIDPQIETGGGIVPALGYLAKYQELIRKSAKGKLTTAELTWFIERFDPAELYAYEQARDLSVDLLQEWLVKYKFKDWKKTQTSKRTVTAAMRKSRAKAIAKALNNTDRWKSHGRGLSMEVIHKELDLTIDDFAADPKGRDHIYGYYRLLKDYMERRGHILTLHGGGQYLGFGGE
jgi:serine dehydrogenase proteinase